MTRVNTERVTPVPEICDTGDSTKKPKEPNYTDKQYKNEGQLSDFSKKTEDLYTNSDVYNENGERATGPGKRIDIRA